MKKYLGLCMIGAFLIACGSNQASQDSQTIETTNNETALKEPGLPPKGKQLIEASDCVGCHKEQEKLVGPSYNQVAKKYENTPKNISMLAGKIINGGKGVWGEIPMTAHPQISKQDAEEMVSYILSLK